MAGGTFKVLLIRFSSLGDVLLTTPAVSAVRESLGDCRITYLTKEAFTPLLEGNPSVDRVVGLKANAGLSDLVRLCRELGTFDAVVDLHGNIRSRVACAALSARRVLRYRKGSLRRRLWSLGYLRGGMEAGEKHVVERYLEALKPLGVRLAPSVPVMYVGEDEVSACRASLARMGLPGDARYGVLVPGARWTNKCWTAEGFSRVGKWLLEERGVRVVLAGDSRDRQVSAGVCRRIGEGCIDATGRTGLRELAALLKGAVLVVGNDSGPGHMAAAVGTPVVTLFGPTSEAFGFRPRGEKTRVVSRDLGCRPCTVHGGTRCPMGRRVCLDELDAGEVIASVQDLLAAG